MFHKLRKYIFLWLPVIFWMIFIFYLSSMPNTIKEFNLFLFILRKLAHFTEFAILYFLLLRAFSQKFININFIYERSSLLLTIFYAFSDEFHQFFVVSRGPAVIDVCIDISGIVFAYSILGLYIKKD